jgi:hypothetical protein
MKNEAESFVKKKGEWEISNESVVLKKIRMFN